MLLVAHRTPPTAAGCARLAAAGATAFEADVQLDGGRVVVSHFLPFLRLRGWVQHDNWRFRWRGGPPHDPLLADVVERVPADSLILLDPKENDPARRADLIGALADALPQRARFRVSTDRADDLERYRGTGFETWRTIKTPAQLDQAVAGDGLPDAGVSVRHTLVTAASLDRLHRVTPTVVAWTVNDVARARELDDFGVEGITTDRIEVMRAIAVDG